MLKPSLVTVTPICMGKQTFEEVLIIGAFPSVSHRYVVVNKTHESNVCMV